MAQPFTLAACAEMLWPDRPIDWRCHRLHEMGFAVGLWNWPNHDLAALERSGARFAIFNGVLRGGLADADSAAALLDSARESIAVGKRLNVARLNLTPVVLARGGRPEHPIETLTGAMWMTARDTLERLADLAEAEGVVFVLENLNTEVDHPGVPFARAADTLALVSGVDRPGLQMNLDLYHVQIGEGNLIETCRRALPWIGEIQVADVPGRHEPGTGEVNWPAVARALSDMGYTGNVTMEARPAGDPDTALEAFRAAFTL